MSEFREIRNLPPLRPILETREDVQLAIQEISVSLGEFAQQWNDCIYQLLGSLPGGRVRRAAQDRSQDIEPIQNGFDGSQVFLDQTARPGDLGGVLHTGLRPKTIKEVILQTTQALGGRLNRVERLLEDLETASGSQYDDSQLRNWLLRLTAETWDPDGIDQGDTVNTGNFAGAPVKSSEYSLAQRDVNLRHLLGIEGLSQGLRELTEVSAISGANYISEDEDIITALLTLDSEINSISVGSTDLQEAYDNTAAGKEIDVAAAPIHILVSGEGTEALRLTGDLALYGDFDTVSAPLMKVSVETTGDSDEGTFYLKFKSSPEEDEFATFSQYKGDTVGSTTEYTALSLNGGNSQVVLNGGEGADLTIYNYPGVGGSGIQSDVPFEIYCYDNFTVTIDNAEFGLSTGTGGIILSGFTASLHGTDTASIVDSDDSFVRVSNGDCEISAETVTITSTNADIDIVAEATLDIDANAIELTAVADITIATGSAGLLFNADAFMEGDGVTLTATADDVVISSASGDVNLTATVDDINLSAGDNVVIQATDDIFILGGESVIVANEDWAIRVNDAGSLYIAGLESVFTSSGIIFGTASTITSGLATGVSEIARIAYLDDWYANNIQQTVNGESGGAHLELASIRVKGYAPVFKGGVAYGGPAGIAAGRPGEFHIYRENVVKAKGMVLWDGSETTSSTETMVPESAVGDGFNIFIKEDDDPDFPVACSWGDDKMWIRFLTPMPHNNYSISLSISDKPGYLFMPQVVDGTQTNQGFAITVYGWQVGTSTDWSYYTGNTTVYIQVI